MKKTAVTVHGPVEYETVTCDSCGEETMKNEAERFVIGGFDCTKYGDHRFDVDNSTLGWICPYCVTEEPASFPTKIDTELDNIDRMILLCWFVFNVVWSLGIVIVWMGIT